MSASRRWLLLGVGAVVLALVAAVVVVRRSGDEPARLTAAESRLDASQRLVDTAIAEYVEANSGTPGSVKVLPDGQLLVGAGARSRAYSPGLGRRVAVGFYRASGADFAYCLSSGGWHVVVAQEGADIRVSRPRGPCPQASLDPKLGPTNQARS